MFRFRPNSICLRAPRTLGHLRRRPTRSSKQLQRAHQIWRWVSAEAETSGSPAAGHHLPPRPHVVHSPTSSSVPSPPRAPIPAPGWVKARFRLRSRHTLIEPPDVSAVSGVLAPMSAATTESRKPPVMSALVSIKFCCPAAADAYYGFVPFFFLGLFLRSGVPGAAIGGGCVAAVAAGGLWSAAAPAARVRRRPTGRSH